MTASEFDWKISDQKTIKVGDRVKLGLSYFKQYPKYKNDKRYLGYPIGALRDVVLTYILVIPLFFIASLWEFLSPWH